MGYPVLLKATGGGGGIGIYICMSKEDLVKNFEAAGRYAHDRMQFFALCLHPRLHPSWTLAAPQLHPSCSPAVVSSCCVDSLIIPTITIESNFSHKSSISPECDWMKRTTLMCNFTNRLQPQVTDYGSGTPGLHFCRKTHAGPSSHTHHLTRICRQSVCWHCSCASVLDL